MKQLLFFQKPRLPDLVRTGGRFNIVKLPILASATATIPGPPASKVRVVAWAVQTSDNVADTLNTTGRIQPANLPIWKNGTSSTSSGSVLGTPTGLVQGESILIQNNAAVNGSILYAYFDVEDIGYTPVRTTFTDTFTTILPAPTDPSKRRKWAEFFISGSGFITLVDRASFAILNDDTVNHNTEFALGGTPIVRATFAPTTPNTATNPPIDGDLVVTQATGAFAAKTTEPITTNPYVAIGLYLEF